MHVDEIVAVIRAGMCRGDKVAECSTCQRKLRAIEAVRAMGEIAQAARERRDDCIAARWCGSYPCGSCAGVDALDALRGDRG